MTLCALRLARRGGLHHVHDDEGWHGAALGKPQGERCPGLVRAGREQSSCQTLRCRKPSNGHGCALTAHIGTPATHGPCRRGNGLARRWHAAYSRGGSSCLGRGSGVGTVPEQCADSALRTRGLRTVQAKTDRERDNRCARRPSGVRSPAPETAPARALAYSLGCRHLHRIGLDRRHLTRRGAEPAADPRHGNRKPTQGLFGPDLQGRRPRLAEHSHAHRAARKLQRLRGGRAQRIHEHRRPHAGQDAQRGDRCDRP